MLIVSATFLLLLGYHLHLWYRVKRFPLSTSIGITNCVRQSWAESVISEKRDILAVQTLRNQVMATTFLASTAILISLGLLSAAVRPGIFEGISHALNLAGARDETLWMVKLLAIDLLFFFAFFNFTLSIRYYNHAAMMINIPETCDAAVNIESVTAILNRGALHYTLGMRGFYLAVPMTLWLFGPLWMMFGTLILLVVLYRLDRTA